MAPRAVEPLRTDSKSPCPRTANPHGYAKARLPRTVRAPVVAPVRAKIVAPRRHINSSTRLGVAALRLSTAEPQNRPTIEEVLEPLTPPLAERVNSAGAVENEEPSERNLAVDVATLRSVRQVDCMSRLNLDRQPFDDVVKDIVSKAGAPAHRLDLNALPTSVLNADRQDGLGDVARYPHLVKGILANNDERTTALLRDEKRITRHHTNAQKDLSIQADERDRSGNDSRVDPQPQRSVRGADVVKHGTSVARRTDANGRVVPYWINRSTLAAQPSRRAAA